MKKIILFIAFLILTLMACAQTPAWQSQDVGIRKRNPRVYFNGNWLGTSGTTGTMLYFNGVAVGAGGVTNWGAIGGVLATQADLQAALNLKSGYPGAGIPVSNGATWGASINNNSTNWNTAFGWGNHASAGYYSGTSATIRGLISSSATGLTYTSGTGVFSTTAGYSIPSTTSQGHWNTAYGWGDHAGLYDPVGTGAGAVTTHETTYNHANYNDAYTDRLKWDGGATGLVAATGRTSLGGTTIGQAFFTFSNPGAVVFFRGNANNSLSGLSAADFKTALTLTSADVSLGNVTNKLQVEVEDSSEVAALRTYATGKMVSERVKYSNVDNGDVEITGEMTAVSFVGDLSGNVTGNVTGQLTDPDSVQANILSSRVILGDEVEVGWIQADSNLIGNPVTRTWVLNQLSGFTGSTDLSGIRDTIQQILAIVENIITEIGGGDFVPPQFESAWIGTKENDTLIVIGTENFDDTSIPTIGAFTITEDGIVFGLDDVVIRTDSVLIALDSAGAIGATFLVSYDKDYGGDQLQDAAENITVSFTNKPVTNLISDFIAEYNTYYVALPVKPGLDTALLQNGLFTSLVNDGYFARTDVMYLIAQRTEAGAKIECTDPGGDDDITDPGSTAPSYTKYQSWTFDGSSDYLSLNFNCSTEADNISASSMTVLVWVLNDEDAATSSVLGAYDTDGTDSRLSITPRNGTIASASVNDNGSISATINPATSIGLISIVRRGDSETEMYKNGESIASDADGVRYLVPEDIFIGARNADGVADRFGLWQPVIVIILDATSDEENLELFNILNTYMTGIGLGVAP